MNLIIFCTKNSFIILVTIIYFAAYVIFTHCSYQIRIHFVKLPGLFMLLI